MKEYKFYGWEQATVLPVNDEYKNVGTPCDMYDAMKHVWSRESCAPRLRDEWSEEKNITRGQCSITAFLVQDIYGGEVFGIPLEEGGVHCLNVVDGHKFDLTSEQFGDRKLDFDTLIPQKREEHFADADKYARYQLIAKGLKDFLTNAT